MAFKAIISGKSRLRSLILGFSGIVPLFIGAHFAHHLLAGQLSPLMPSIRNEFTLSYTQVGFLLGSLSFIRGFVNLPAGWLADHVSRRILITLGISGVALAAVLVGLSQSYIMLTIFLALLILMASGYHPAAAPLVAQSVEPKKRGAALGLHMIGGPASDLLTPLIAIGIATLWTWRSSYILLAIPVFAFGIVFYVLLGRRVPDTKSTQDRIIKTEKTGSKPAGSASDVPPGPFRWAPLVSFLVLAIVCGVVSAAPTAYLSLFLVDRFGASQQMLGVFLSIVGAGALVGGPLGGYLADRIGAVRIMAIVFLVAGPLIYLLNSVPYGVALAVIVASMGMVNHVRIPVSEAYVINHSPSRYRSTVLGVYYFGAAEMGSVLTPVMGNLIDRFGFQTALNIAAGATMILALIFSVYLWLSRKSASSPSTNQV